MQPETKAPFFVPFRGFWDPTKEEAARFRVYQGGEHRGKDGSLKIVFWPGREPWISFLLAGRDPPKEIVGGTRYFVECRPHFMNDQMRVRRVIRIFQWDTGYPSDTPTLTTEIILRPISVLECWLVGGGPDDLIRTYRDKKADEVLPWSDSGLWIAAMVSAADHGKVPLEASDPDTLQLAIDEQTGTSLTRPDWRFRKAVP